MSRGESMHAVIGGERAVPFTVPYSAPRPKPKGLDWEKLRPADEPKTEIVPATVAEVRQHQMADHRANVESVEQLEGAPKKPRLAPDPVDVPEPAQPVEAPRRSIEIKAIVSTLKQTEGSTDMVVAACRATVIAAADALRGAHLRAIEASERADRP